MNKSIHLCRANGKPYDLLHLQPEDMPIEQLANALAQVNRFGGQTPWPYSVATHSVLVSIMLPTDYQYEGLMHDLTEGTALNDMVKPVKNELPGYSELEDCVRGQLAIFYGFPAEESPQVKAADKLAGQIESYFLRYTERPEGMTYRLECLAAPLLNVEIDWRMSREMFLNQYRHLLAQRGYM